MEKITEKAHAKINLTLTVGKKRKDGYHEIDTIMHAIDLHDTITLEKSENLKLTVEEGKAPEKEENLMWKTAEEFYKKIKEKPQVHMKLYKRIPAQAGLGGGSADAAAVLRGLNKLTKANRTKEELCEIGVKYGADIPFCIYEGSARCRGIGEKIKEIKKYEKIPLIIVQSETTISTKEAYEEIDKSGKRNINKNETVIQAIEERNIKKLKENIYNDFEKALFEKNKELKEIKTELKKISETVQMSGSGSAFFIICEKEEQEKIMKKLKETKKFKFIQKATTI